MLESLKNSLFWAWNKCFPYFEWKMNCKPKSLQLSLTSKLWPGLATIGVMTQLATKEPSSGRQHPTGISGFNPYEKYNSSTTQLNNFESIPAFSTMQPRYYEGFPRCPWVLGIRDLRAFADPRIHRRPSRHLKAVITVGGILPWRNGSWPLGVMQLKSWFAKDLLWHDQQRMTYTCKHVHSHMFIMHYW